MGSEQAGGDEVGPDQTADAAEPIEPEAAEPHEPIERGALALDELGEKLEAFQVLRKSDHVAADRILGELGAHDGVDRDIVLELGARAPLGHPDRFPEAHALAVRSLEVLDRNGARSVRVPKKLGPLSPIVQYLVQLVTRFLIRSYLASVIDNMLRLYIRREANCLKDDPSRPMLYRARRHAERLTPGFKRNPLGVPTFLLGGAVVSGVLQVVQRAVVAAVSAWWAKALVTLVLMLLFAGASWVILRGAAFARRRIVLTAEQPVAALWQTVGRCGNPPQDSSKAFALIALILSGVAFLIVPIGVVVTIFT